MNRRDVLKQSALFMGYSVSVGALSELFTACSKPVSLTWEPIFLTDSQANTITEIAETILPRTGTPGAKDIGVPQFIDKMLNDLLSEDEQARFIDGLNALDEAAEEAYGTSFVEATPAQREALLLRLDHEAAKTPLSLWGITLEDSPPTAFYRQLKGLTLLGYFTSEQVGKKILSYDPLPGNFIACMPLPASGMNAWNE
ncbi:gluconate 2-dehydrogenase subunit 3 family protein [Spirosoma sordidisoli]|uniref:Gluconate 2-dehydrogenase subunit 3 family protein n=1 Tax=Spirosoma sordidisoli TaxID=2502893 RepID=A0A4Q2UNT1_9BACT|nr:gluconate 2-dehydrogenase subunit 3 family protein [Spirosoma sordidisoli]RYC68469.1 gluconate 2-dehydrogenase subunit 3 family protein [Spirosoma sordidisoli]